VWFVPPLAQALLWAQGNQSNSLPVAPLNLELSPLAARVTSLAQYLLHQDSTFHLCPVVTTMDATLSLSETG
jgi:hypothetical protein